MAQHVKLLNSLLVKVCGYKIKKNLPVNDEILFIPSLQTKWISTYSPLCCFISRSFTFIQY